MHLSSGRTAFRVGTNPVSRMASGSKMLSRMYLESWPLTVSTMRPAQSMLMPYSQRSPGSNAGGAFSAASLPDMIVGSGGLYVADSVRVQT
jgi:hypothetical protein